MKISINCETENEYDEKDLRLMLNYKNAYLLLEEIEQYLWRPNVKHGYSDPKLKEFDGDDNVHEAIYRLSELYYEMKSEYNIEELD